ncbi:MAG: 3'-5' exonuclease [Spirochaetes bacterium]|nr:3'-5' exonuclease [Spirochaetota bacterium]
MKKFQCSSEPAPFSRLQSILSKKQNTFVLVLDLETNGLSSRYSVLSVTAEKYLYSALELERVGRFHRFYYPREAENPDAIRVNGLTREKLEQEREGKGWPAYFDEDYEFLEFCKGIDLVVGHNIHFDLKFLPFLKGVDWFCTMKSHTSRKFPSLERLARRYGIPVQQGRLHQGDYDVALTVEIFRRILHDLEIYLAFETTGDPSGRVLTLSSKELERIQEVRKRLALEE